MTRWNASTDSLLRANVSPTIEPATTMPTIETPINPATRATALLTADAIPASWSAGVGEHRRRERGDGEREAEARTSSAGRRSRR